LSVIDRTVSMTLRSVPFRVVMNPPDGVLVLLALIGRFRSGRYRAAALMATMPNGPLPASQAIDPRCRRILRRHRKARKDDQGDTSSVRTKPWPGLDDGMGLPA
jgi:hypothetical protein